MVSREEEVRAFLDQIKEPDFSDFCFQQVLIYISSLYSMKALHTPKVMNIHIRHCGQARACPPASRYANDHSSTLASWRSAVSKPSMNQA
jgi:hypothetical protein